MIRTFGKIITGNTFLTSGICDATVALECDPPVRVLITAMRFYKVTFVSIGVHSWFMIRTFGKIITGNTFLTSGICDVTVALECDPPVRIIQNKSDRFRESGW